MTMKACCVYFSLVDPIVMLDKEKSIAISKTFLQLYLHTKDILEYTL